jgi:hypothetical protein
MQDVYNGTRSDEQVIICGGVEGEKGGGNSRGKGDKAAAARGRRAFLARQQAVTTKSTESATCRKDGRGRPPIGYGRVSASGSG